MATVTIPKEITQGAELVVVPRTEYDTFLRWRRLAAKTFTPTPAQRRDLARARKEFARGEYVRLDELGI